VAADVTGWRGAARLPGIAAAAIACIGSAVAVATAALTIADRQSPSQYALAGLDVGASQAIGTTIQTIGLITVSSIAAIVVWRRPKALLSLLAMQIVVFLALQAFAAEYAVYGLVVAPGSVPFADVAAWSQEFANDLGGLGAALFVLLFPDSRLRSPRWRLLVVLVIVYFAIEMLVFLDEPYPLRMRAPGPQWVPVTLPPVVWSVGASMSFASGAVSWGQPVIWLLIGIYVIRRLTSATGELRLQFKWFAYAAAIFVVASVVQLVDNPPALDWLPDRTRLAVQQFVASETAHAIASWSGLLSAVAGSVLLPVAIGVAMVRYRLYDIDIVINKTILYGGLAVFVTGVYAIVVAGLGSLLGQRAGLNSVLSILTIALLAALLLPVRARLQDIANRAVYGKRAKPYDVISEFAGSIGHAEPSEVLLPRMAELLRSSTGASATEVWAKVGDRLQLAASSPAAQAQPTSVFHMGEIAARFAGGASVEPVFHDGEELGALVVVKPRGEELSAVERRLFHDLASQAGMVLGRFRLVQELRESRSRIVASQDQERHRIERNLHDGAQQRFVNALLALGMAQEEGSRRPDLLVEVSREVQAGLNELRSLARGLEPPLLNEAGLVAAVSALADTAPVVTTVDADSRDRRYARSIETAAYFVVAEALTNAVKHSGAKAVEIRIKETERRLGVEVRDDGAGGADVSRGSGLIGLQDRVAAVGGRMVIESQPGEGTTIRAELPCE
jgi:signal transduction histidine kinase